MVFSIFIEFLFYLRFLARCMQYISLLSQPKIFALNPFAPRFCIIKNSLKSYDFFVFLVFSFIYLEFLMIQPRLEIFILKFRSQRRLIETTAASIHFSSENFEVFLFFLRYSAALTSL